MCIVCKFIYDSVFFIFDCRKKILIPFPEIWKVWWYTYAPTCKLNYVNIQHSIFTYDLCHNVTCNIFTSTCEIIMSTCDLLNYVTCEHNYVSCKHDYVSFCHNLSCMYVAEVCLHRDAFSCHWFHNISL